MPGLHEAREALSEETLEQHRAIASLMEELEAIDWYSQRLDACQDAELRAVIAHNRDEEIEHACMALEWLRRRNPVFEHHLRERLFREAPIVEAGSEPAPEGSGYRDAGSGALHIGSLRSPLQSREGRAWTT